jgi:hypothetical protein
MSAQSLNREEAVGRTPFLEATPKESEGVPITASCSVDDLRKNLQGYVPSRVANEPVLGYKALPSQDLGGALVIDFACDDSSSKEVLRSAWLLVKEEWRIEKISRPPQRQSGDL